MEIDVWTSPADVSAAVMTASDWSRFAEWETGGAAWISACCAVMIMNEAPLVLALDTSTVVNVGLARGDQVLATATVADQMAHVEQLTPLVSECVDTAGIRMADLDQLIVGPRSGAVYRAASRCCYCAGAQLRAGLALAWRLQSRRTGRTIC